MNTLAIDTNTINSLFDNQKKVDELFDSIFDDDNFFIASSYSSQSENRRSVSSKGRQISSYADNSKESFLAIRARNPYYMVLPILLEIAAIYFVAINLM